MFVTLSPKLTDDIKIQIDNKFIVYFMPSAPSDYVKVYLYGLSLSSTNSELMTRDNSLDRIAKILQMNEDDILKAYEYWADVGVVNLNRSTTTPIVEYLPTIDTKSTVVKKYNVKKYKEFNEQLAKAAPNRNFLPQELNEYYQIMESLGIKPDAMLYIIAYCIKLKDIDISSKYILTVARNLATRDGAISYEAIENKLNEIKLYENDILDIFRLLKLKRNVEHDDKDMYVKWLKTFRFNKDVIHFVAKDIKKGGMTKLDTLLTKYNSLTLLSIGEITSYTSNQDNMHKLARDITKILGVWYDQTGYIVDTYIQKWLGLGFDNNSIIRIAEYCHKANRRTIDALDQTLQRFYKEGRVSETSISDYVVQVRQADEFIKKLLDILEENRIVTSRDRDLYRTWTYSWRLPIDLIEYAATLSKGKLNAMGYLGSIIADWHSLAINTVASAKARVVSTKGKSPNHTSNLNKHAVIQNTVPMQEVSMDEVNAIFDSLPIDDI